MSNNINKLINIFNSNSNGVIATITNNTINFELNSTEQFDFSQIEGSLEIPAVSLLMNFSGDQNFQVNFIVSKKLTAILSDMMMLGDGQVDYNPEEHNDAIQEMFNQVLGSMSSELAGDSISLTGNVTQVELTDFEIQKDFLEGNMMAKLSVNLLDEDHAMFFTFDSFAETSIDSLFPTADDSMPDMGGMSDMDMLTQAFGQPEQDMSSSQIPVNEKPVTVQKASLSELNNTYTPSPGSAPNIDMLLDINLPITVELGRKHMKVKEILGLGQGSVVELDKTAGDYVDLIVNGKKFAIGEVMVADENYAVRIVSLVSRSERIKSLGK
jgi:flagellar motor switch protein FliN/FliY